MSDTIYMAPLQGYTEYIYRRAYSHFFSGVDVAVSPFIPLAEGFIYSNKHLRDVLPERNRRMNLIPQALGNDPVKFIQLAKRLVEMGYAHMDWNLGCPKGTVTRKKRGSGLLPFPDRIRHILDKMMPGLPLKLSIKTRLGLNSPEEFGDLIEVFNDYPLQCLMIHPRIGSQMYEGDMFLDFLDPLICKIKHDIVFSGDIRDQESFNTLKARYPKVSGWMIGRGILVNPFLPQMLKDPAFEMKDWDTRTKLLHFHEELLCEIRYAYKHEHAVLNKMKDYWSYFARWFVDEGDIFNQLAHHNNLSDFIEDTKYYFEEQALAAFEGRLNRPVKVS